MSRFSLSPPINPYTNSKQLEAAAIEIGFGIQEEYLINSKVELLEFAQSPVMDNKTYDNSYDCYRIYYGKVVAIEIGRHTGKKIYRIIKENGCSSISSKNYMRPLC